MSLHPKSINLDAMAVTAASVMENNKLSHILVTDAEGHLVGALHMHDLMTAKVI